MDGMLHSSFSNDLAKAQAPSLARQSASSDRPSDLPILALNQTQPLEISCNQCIQEIYAHIMVQRVKFA
jgi:hypothetical protein